MDHQAFLADMASVLDVDESEINDGFLFNEDNFDSVAVVGTIALIDEHFGVTVDGKALGSCKTIGELLQLIEETTEAK